MDIRIWCPAGFILQKLWYSSLEWKDEIAWLPPAIRRYERNPVSQRRPQVSNNSFTEYSWDNKGGGLHVFLYHLTKKDEFKVNVKAYFDLCWTRSENPRGLGFYFFWGSLSYAANAAFLMLWHSKELGPNDPYAKSLNTYAVQYPWRLRKVVGRRVRRELAATTIPQVVLQLIYRLPAARTESIDRR
ncbi:hypothetical protein BC938DRAFT_476192 [Jimgerdemannia flammicorona]|uniref:cellulase n=1 Tax=Jimgerdemannia flammicorona TaxID=994334 RepID=A0A433QZ60_9FUNG|nr:hypothetical protein BC938DRAFT_476192 [Jimgerdemannia flammicorona]